jgi:hypothetical protein
MVIVKQRGFKERFGAILERLKDPLFDKVDPERYKQEHLSLLNI